MAMARAPSARAAGWQLGNQDRLADYMDDVEDVDYARLRVAMPAAVLMAGLALLAGATAWLTPLAFVPIVLLSVAVMATLRRLMRIVGQQWAPVSSSQRTAGRVLGGSLASVVPLQAERAFPGNLTVVFTQFNDSEAARLAQRRAFAVLDMLAGLAGPLAALSVLAAAWPDGPRRTRLL